MEREQLLVSSSSSTDSINNSIPFNIRRPSIQKETKQLNLKTRARKLAFQRRIIKSKAVVYILIVNALQSFNVFLTVNAVFGEILARHHRSLAMTFIIGIQTGGFSALFFPIGGVLGDVYLGRHFISVVCIFISFFSTVILSFALSISQNIQESNAAISIAFKLVIPLSALLILAVCDGIFEVNWLTFGADQLINSPSEEGSSYIYWWSWTKNLGLVIAIFTNTAIHVVCAELSNYKTVAFVMPSIAPFLSSIACAIALFIDNRASLLYDRERVNINPIKQIFGVLHNAYTSRPEPSAYTSAFRYGEDPPSGLDFAREHHGGKYTDEQVENVKCFGRILVMIIAISGYYCVYLAFHNKAGTEFHENISYALKWNWETEALVSLRGSLESLVDSSLILVLLPLWNHVVFPLLGHYTPNTRKRIGFGSVIGVIGMLVAAILNIHHRTSISQLYWIPFVLIVIAETMVLVPALEFIYAQSPDNMKGLLIGFHYFLIGMWAVVVALSINLIPDFNEFYFCYFAVGVCGLMLFLLISCNYRNRKRNNPITDIMRISSYYSN